MDKLHFRQVAKPTPFHDRTQVLNRGNDWLRWAGYTTPQTFTTEEFEYFAIRNAATIYDISPMSKYRITGPDAEDFLNRLVTRNIAKLKDGRVSYTLWCDDQGHTIDDGTLFRFAPNDYRLCCQEHQLGWLLESALGFDVKITDETDTVAGLALQGPTSAAVLKALGLSDVENLKPFGYETFSFSGAPLGVSRTGFTGDLGYELWVDPAKALDLWDGLMEAGVNYNIRPIGSGALNLARIEAGFVQTNADFISAHSATRASRGRSPLSLGLDWIVDFDKGHFTGRRALLAEKQNGSPYMLVGLEIEGNKASTHSLVYHKGKIEAGFVTSGMWSPTMKKNLALAELKAPYGQSITDDLWVEIYLNKELKWDKRMCRVKLAARPFYTPARRRAVPALDY